MTGHREYLCFPAKPIKERKPCAALTVTLESNDSDYHIVVTDDTHQFTDHQGNHMGHSVVAEIPDPGCPEGKDHSFPGSTPFATAISAALALSSLTFLSVRREDEDVAKAAAGRVVHRSVEGTPRALLSFSQKRPAAIHELAEVIPFLGEQSSI